MNFQFDQRKSLSNQQKHGINFVEAQAVRGNPDRLVIPARTVDEPRYMIVGRMQGITWSGIFTIRGDNIRIISVRQTRKEEVDLYESERVG